MISEPWARRACVAISLICLAIPVRAGAEELGARYLNTSGSDGCDPGNLGHRLGGDLSRFEDNTLAGMKGIAHMQTSRCFKAWETDLHQGEDAIILSHDPVFKGRQVSLLTTSDLPLELVILQDFVEAFIQLDLTRPLILDVKDVSNHALWPELIWAARRIKQLGEIPVWFLISNSAADAHQGICSFIDGEFEILRYGRRGPLCDS